MLQRFAQEPALTDRVRDAILEAIVDGSLRPGERLAQVQIAESLGVSRQPVSHALSVLKEQGILVELGRKGLTVAPMEAEHVRHLYHVRGALDALAARLAADRVAAGESDVDALNTLTTTVCDFESNSSRPGTTTAGHQVDADIAFHTAIYALSGNPVLEELARPQWVRFRRCMLTVIEDNAIRTEVWGEHAHILNAILDGDAERAAQCAVQHTERAGETTATRLSQSHHITPSVVQEQG